MDNQNLCIIILILACVSILIYLLWRVKKDGLRAVVVELIVFAENTYLKGQNREKMMCVVDALTKLIPMPFRLFITAEAIEKFAQQVFNEIKVALNNKVGSN